MMYYKRYYSIRCICISFLLTIYYYYYVSVLEPPEYDYPYLINNVSRCYNSPPLDYFVYILSAPTNFELRDAIRSNWASVDRVVDATFRHTFFIGNPVNSHTQDMIVRESRTYGDLIQIDVIDIYQNISRKSVAILQWLSMHCSANYLIKSDDDIFVDIAFLTTILRSYYHDNLPSNTIHCKIWTTSLIIRSPDPPERWQVPLNILPNQTYYRQYCDGRFYVLSNDMPSKLYKAAKKTPLFFIDDVYITGLVARKVKDITYVEWNKYFTPGFHNPSFNEQYSNKSKPKQFVMSDVYIKQFPIIWKLMNQK